MPVYIYHCEENGQTVEVRHGIDHELSTWGEVCYTAQIPLGETDFLSPVRKVLTPPGIAACTLYWSMNRNGAWTFPAARESSSG